MNILFSLKRWYGNLTDMGNSRVLFVMFKDEEQGLQYQQFVATLVYEDGGRCYVGSFISPNLLFELCPMLEEWQKVKGSDVPEGWLCRDMGERTTLLVNKRVEALFLELTSSFDSPKDFARNWDEVAKAITKRLNAHLNLRQRIVLRWKRFVRSYKRDLKIFSELSLYETILDDWS